MAYFKVRMWVWELAQQLMLAAHSWGPTLFFIYQLTLKRWDSSNEQKTSDLPHCVARMKVKKIWITVKSHCYLEIFGISLPVGYSGHMHLGEVKKVFKSNVYHLFTLFILKQKCPLQHPNCLIIGVRQMGDRSSNFRFQVCGGKESACSLIRIWTGYRGYNLGFRALVMGLVIPETLGIYFTCRKIQRMAT